MSGGSYGAGGAGAAGGLIYTDDVSLQVFMEHLKRLVSPWQRSKPLRLAASSADPATLLLVQAVGPSTS